MTGAYQATYRAAAPISAVTDAEREEARRHSPSPLLTDEGPLGNCQDDRTRRRCEHWHTCSPAVISGKMIVCARVTCTDEAAQKAKYRTECDARILAYLKTQEESVTFQAILQALRVPAHDDAMRALYKGSLQRLRREGRIESTGHFRKSGRMERPVKLWRIAT